MYREVQGQGMKGGLEVGRVGSRENSSFLFFSFFNSFTH